MAILDKNRNHARQYPVYAVQDFSVSEISNGGTINVIKLPPGARVVSGGMNITTAFNDTTDDDAFTVGDATLAGVTIDVDEYDTSVDGDSLGYVAFELIPGAEYASGAWITLTHSATTGDADEGAGIMFVEYIVDGKINEVVPDYD